MISGAYTVIRKRRVLVVYDDRESARQISIALRAANYQVVLAADGASSVSIAQQCNPDAILMDVSCNAPIMAAWLREQQCLRDSLAVVFAIDGERTQGIGHIGTYPIVSKPIQVEELLDKIETALSEAMKNNDRSNQQIVPPLSKWNTMDRDLANDIERIDRVIDSFSIESAVEAAEPSASSEKTPDESKPRPSKGGPGRSANDIATP